jgi:hypothetical protein
LSLRAFARRLGVSHTAVEKAIATGRLARSVVRDRHGKPRIADPEVATREWVDNVTKPAPPTNAVGGFSSLAEAQRRLAVERARKLRIENLQKQGRLIDRSLASSQSFDCARTVRDAILGVPDRIAAELAAETDTGRVHRRLENELRVALASLAEVLSDETADLGVAAGGGAHGRR